MKLKKLMLGAMALMLVSGICFAHADDHEDEDGDFSSHSANGSTDNSPKSGLGFVVAGGGEFGGDKVATIVYTDNSTQSVNSGQGVTLAVGAHYQFASPSLDIMATVGYKYVTTKASNANIYIGRVVAGLQASYWFNQSWWVGLGPTWHLNNAFHGAQLVENLKFDPALGVTLQAGWKFVALSYTNINYTDQFKNKYNASNVGLMLIGRF